MHLVFIMSLPRGLEAKSLLISLQWDRGWEYRTRLAQVVPVRRKLLILDRPQGVEELIEVRLRMAARLLELGAVVP